MDQNFTTTFIPKKPIVPAASPRMRRPMGLVATISFLVTLIVAILAGGLYFYKQYLTTQGAELKASIERAEKSFEPTLLVQLQELDRRLMASDKLVKSHIAITPFLDLLGQQTLPAVRFTKFSYTFDDSGKPIISLSGEGDSYRSIAQQSELFAKQIYIRDHIFSNFILTPKARISFDLMFNVQPDLLNYASALRAGRILEVAAAPAPATQTPPATNSQSQSPTTTPSGTGSPAVTSPTF